MDIKSLMVGDWVQLKTYGVSDKFERTEAYIFVKVAEIGSGLITVDYNNDIKEPYRICENKEIEPILITPEILEKNGIKYQWGMPWYQGGFDGVFELHYNNSQDIAFGDTPTEIQIPISYVHQLQHALRLCGFDKEITL